MLSTFRHEKVYISISLPTYIKVINPLPIQSAFFSGGLGEQSMGKCHKKSNTVMFKILLVEPTILTSRIALAIGNQRYYLPYDVVHIHT